MGAPPVHVSVRPPDRAPGERPDDEAILRPVGAFAVALEAMANNGSLLKTRDEGTVARRSMRLEDLARITDSPAVTLPAVAA